MNTTGYIIIPYRGVDYKINKEKLEYTISYLENRKVAIKDNTDIKSLLRKCKLLNEDFLENINKI